VHLHPHEALLQQTRELQRSPAFAEARRRRQVVEHRIARLVQLGIRQARHVGQTKTLFQVCLAAAVANLTLLAPNSDVPSETGSGWPLMLLVPLLTLSGLPSPFGLTLFRPSTSSSPRPPSPSNRPDRLVSNTPLSATLLAGC